MISFCNIYGIFKGTLFSILKHWNSLFIWVITNIDIPMYYFDDIQNCTMGWLESEIFHGICLNLLPPSIPFLWEKLKLLCFWFTNNSVFVKKIYYIFCFETISISFVRMFRIINKNRYILVFSYVDDVCLVQFLTYLLLMSGYGCFSSLRPM